MKKIYRGIIFDLDGTLLDTIDDLADSMNEVLKIYGYPGFTREEYKLKIGGGFKGLALNSFSEATDPHTIEEAIILFSEIYDRKYMDKTKVYEGIDYILDEINKRGLKLGVNSNKKDEYTRVLTNRFFKRIPFVEIHGEREGVEKKPDPIAALDIIEKMGLTKDEVLYVGDSKVDIMTAKNAGLDSLGVLWGFRDYEELSKHGADYIVADPKEILDII